MPPFRISKYRERQKKSRKLYKTKYSQKVKKYSKNKKNKTIKKGGMYHEPSPQGTPQGNPQGNPPPSLHLTSSSVLDSLSSSNSMGVGSSQAISISTPQSTPSPTYTPQPILPLPSAPFLPLFNPPSPSDRPWDALIHGLPNIPNNSVWVSPNWADLTQYGTMEDAMDTDTLKQMTRTARMERGPP